MKSHPGSLNPVMTHAARTDVAARQELYTGKLIDCRCFLIIPSSLRKFKCQGSVLPWIGHSNYHGELDKLGTAH